MEELINSNQPWLSQSVSSTYLTCWLSFCIFVLNLILVRYWSMSKTSQWNSLLNSIHIYSSPIYSCFLYVFLFYHTQTETDINMDMEIHTHTRTHTQWQPNSHCIQLTFIFLLTYSILTRVYPSVNVHSFITHTNIFAPPLKKTPFFLSRRAHMIYYFLSAFAHPKLSPSISPFFLIRQPINVHTFIYLFYAFCMVFFCSFAF